MKIRMNNKGISLLEYVIVFAIISVVGAVMAFSLSALLNKPAEQCAAQLKTSIDKHRQVSMGKNSSDMQLYVTSNGVFIKEVYDGEEKITQVGAKGVEVKYKTSTGYNTVNSTGVHIQFKRGIGSLEPYSGEMIQEYQVSKGSVTKTLKIVPLTGKVTVE